MKLSPLENEFFKLIFGDTYEEYLKWNPKVTAYQKLDKAKAAAALCERKMKEAWDEGYIDGSSDGQSYSAGYQQKAKNPYED